jgi:ankyrin repeat protein
MNKIKLPEFKGNNLLFHAVFHSNAIDCINLLESTFANDSDKEADINARNVNGCTPLHFAVQSENVNMVKIVLKYGGDPNSKVALPVDSGIQ